MRFFTRSPPDIFIKPLERGCQELCLVKALAAYLSMSPDTRGILFRNSVTEVPLQAATISKLCSVIEEAIPNCLPLGHDVRKMATSLAWTRGLSMTEITQRAFWRSSNPFIDSYMFNAKRLMLRVVWRSTHVLGYNSPPILAVFDRIPGCYIHLF